MMACDLLRTAQTSQYLSMNPPSFSRGTPSGLVDSGQSTERSHCHEDVWQFVSNITTMYNFPRGERNSFKFFLKSKNGHMGTILPNSHSTDCRTLLIAVLKACCSSLRFCPGNGHMTGGSLGHRTQWGADHQGHSCLWLCGQEFQCYSTVQSHGGDLTWAQTGWL